MSRRKLAGGIFATCGSLAVLVLALHVDGPRDSEGAPPLRSVAGVSQAGAGGEDLVAGWSIRLLTRVTDSVNSLVVSPFQGANRAGNVFIGTTGAGALYRMNVLAPKVLLTISPGLGDVQKFGDCWVNRLVVRDIDGDGSPELIASTSQIQPRGRPRLYVWSLTSTIPVLQVMARPDIRSSWSHGLGFLPRDDSGAESLFLTFCGHGEVVEYDYRPSNAAGSFQGASLGWKQVGQLPSSGEWSQTADLDNDGRIDICLATGFAQRRAAIQAYSSPSRGADLVLSREINEQGRFANVKFLVGSLRGDGTNDLMAWWCTDHLSGGDCEVIRYHLGPEGVRARQVVARGKTDLLWPNDGQTALVDMDADGHPEVYFATDSGNLWQYTPDQAKPLARILKDSSLGPIAGGLVPGSSRPALILARGCEVLRLDCATSPSSSGEPTDQPGNPPRTPDEPQGDLAVE